MNTPIGSHIDLAAILDHVGDAITVHDAEGLLVFANAAAREIGFTVGKPRTHVDALPDGLTLLDDAGVAIVADNLPGRRALSGELSPAVVVGVRSNRSAAVRWVRVRSRGMHDNSGAIEYVVSVWRDVTDRRLSEERDRALAAIVTTSDDAIVSKTLDGTITSWNPAAERLFGWTADEMIGNSIARIVPLDRRGELAEILRRLSRGERIDHHETKRRTKDGRILDISVSISPLIDSSGRVVGASKIARDVTARKRDEASQRLLAEAGAILTATVDVEKTLAAVAQLATGSLAESVVVSLVSPDGMVSQVAAAFADSVRAGLPAHPAQSEIDVEDADIASVIATGRSIIRPTPITSTGNLAVGATEAGNDNWIARMIVPMVARDRSIGAFDFMTTDPGRRYDERDLGLAEELARRAALAVDNARLYAAARAAEARYRGLFRSGGVGVVVVADSRILDANESALRMMGLSLDELRERDVDAESLVGGLDAWTKLQKGGAWHGETELKGVDGNATPVEVYASAIDLPEGRVFLVQLHDVSARKMAEQFEDEFLADLAHDLNNPLTAARTQTQLLRRRIKRGSFSAENADQALAAIEQTTGRMARRIGELADLARLRLGRPLELRRQTFDLTGRVRDLVNTFQMTTTRHRLQVDAESPVIQGEWDADRLDRVFDNLLSNAIKYSPNGGPILIRLGRDEDERGNERAVVAVCDRGVGIPAADLPYIFDRYRRGRNVLTRIAGTGIGLAGARYVVEAHGGTIEVTSTEGKGTTVTVRLPVALPNDDANG